ncbi:MAG TPA: EAL domain-containing protein [Solirubrobacteraceae bacterium]|jgi:EAL domain-containing protein (putative c-di-GMP-specific phosphodiesterase class I)|nr:EAL domain-containing protein [Solirubrobacteraceae bacterium]
MTLADCTVMVVEDHEFQRRTTLQILANLGAGGLLEAADGEGALALLHADPRPDIVVCDLDMPGMDGVEFLRHVSELRAGTAIVIASGLDESVLRSAETTARGYGLEVLGAIRKPLTARLLLQAVGLHRPQSGPAPPPADPVDDPWIAALEEERVIVSLRPSVELASGRLGAIEVRAYRFDASDRIDAASDPHGPARGDAAGEIAERVAQAGLEAQRLLGDAGELVGVTLVLPPAALVGDALVRRLAELAVAAAIEPARICVALPDARDASPASAPLDVLTRLRVHGFGLGIDGFGAARVTLPELGQLPLTEVKIAAAGVAAATASLRGAEAFTATVQALRDQGLDVVCDGCDSRTEWELALQAGCRRAQGALVGPSLAPDELAGWLASWSGVA